MSPPVLSPAEVLQKGAEAVIALSDGAAAPLWRREDARRAARALALLARQQETDDPAPPGRDESR